MKIAYLILAHTDPHHIARLSGKLSGPHGGHVFVHVDKKVDITPFETSLQGIQGVSFTDRRVAVHWGGFSAIEATIELYRAALLADTYDRFILLQGLDYPIRSNMEIQRFFERHKDVEFIRAARVTNADPLTVRHKYQLLWNLDASQAGHGIRNRLNSLRLRLRLVPNHDIHAPRTGGGRMDVFEGWAHIALTREAVQYVVNFYDSSPEFNHYYQRVYAADESYFHTIVHNSYLAPRVASDWIQRELGGLLPRLNLTYFEYPDTVRVFKEVSDYDFLKSTGYLFFRKATSDSSRLLDHIDGLHRQE